MFPAVSGDAACLVPEVRANARPVGNSGRETVLPRITDMKKAWNERANRDPFFYVETELWDHDKGKFFELGRARARELIDPVFAKYNIDPGDKTAVDVGCGVGRFTQALGIRFAKAVGVDVSEVMVEQAKIAAAEFSNLEFVSGDGVALPCPSDSAILSGPTKYFSTCLHMRS